ncbi:hypothetical protein [Bacillus licheniformis]|uniref:hypothetical protein n=1 Tax=Bacillus licheniformis TaxID=1402 RepID=UPI0011A4DB06|nr:hypothetical protein [Bacillus licheniformis]
MNLLEQYIQEVHNEEPYSEPWTKRFEDEFAKAEITTNSYGVVKRHTEVWTKKQWNDIKKQGYYMG